MNQPNPKLSYQKGLQTALKTNLQFSKSLFALVLALTLALTSCLSTKLPPKNDYFQDLKSDTVLTGLSSKNYENLIEPGDKLLIQATSLNGIEDAIFNQGGGETAGEGTGAFLVQPNGTILLHRLGVIKVAGLTRRKLADQLRDDLSAYMKDVIVTVTFVNHKITIMGAVASPQVIPMKDEQVPLLDAIIMSGDVDLLSRTDKVIIIREVGDTKQVKHVNLQQSAILQSEWYYLKPNDIVFIPKDHRLELEEQKKQKKDNIRNAISFAASGLSLLILILDRILRN